MPTISGILERITFQNEETGFTVAQLRESGKKGRDLTPVVGIMPGLAVGATLRLSGQWQRDKRYGQQFKVENWQVSRPNTLNGLERYLGSGLIKGVGPSYAKRIVATFGMDTLEVLEREPGRLKEVPGLGKARVEQIKVAWGEQRHIHEIMVFLQGHTVPASYAVKIYKFYGAEAMSVVKENPYRLAEDIWGIGFKIADEIAQSLGIPAHDPRRARAGLLFVLGQALSDGHCFLEREPLIAAVTTLLEQHHFDGFVGLVAAEIPQLVADEKIVLDGERIYLAPFFFAERGVTAALAGILGSGRYPDIQVGRELRRAAQKMGLQFAVEQEKAVCTALEQRLTIITGGPGTGKSTILKALLLILGGKGVDSKLCAPTGRAAKRLSQACARPAKTIHRLLEFDPFVRGFKRNDDNPLDCDLLIVDEASMLDIILANSLLKALPPGCGLVMVGDVDQLPSVGAGNVLRDAIDSGVIPCVRLQQIFRQDEGSLISVNAARINKGQFFDPLPGYQGERDFYFMERQQPEEIAREIVTLCAGRLRDKYGFDALHDIQVLCPMKKGEIGTDNLNALLQQALLQSGPVAKGGHAWREGDKVMQIRNNYDKDVYNGDMGFVVRKRLESDEIMVEFDGRQVSYGPADLQELQLAYAVTVHKSQGSEFPCVIVPLHMSHYPLLQRNLLYTAITRGKKLVIVIGQSKAVSRAIGNDRVTARNTMLAQRLRHWPEALP